jgi:lincosamide nucleotidyltransferase A/C/D/E
MSMMMASDVLDFYIELERLGVTVWVDGGWGVDALIGMQTRSHQDLDVAIEQRNVAALLRLLETRGYREIKLQQARPWNFVFGDEGGREIDIHVIVINDRGDGIYGPADNGEIYPAASLTGMGSILGQSVKCISAEWSIKFHSGYELKEKDFRDVSALCDKFRIPLPEVFGKFKK